MLQQTESITSIKKKELLLLYWGSPPSVPLVLHQSFSDIPHTDTNCFSPQCQRKQSLSGVSLHTAWTHNDSLQDCIVTSYFLHHICCEPSATTMVIQDAVASIPCQSHENSLPGGRSSLHQLPVHPWCSTHGPRAAGNPFIVSSTRGFSKSTTCCGI